jgi:hypothetical protein
LEDGVAEPSSSQYSDLTLLVPKSDNTSVVCCAGLLGANKGIVVESFNHPDLFYPLHCFSNAMNFTYLYLSKLNI